MTDKEVLEDNYGGDMLNGLVPPQQRTQARTLKKFTNAYMLVYVRETELDTVLAPFTEGDTPPHLSQLTRYSHSGSADASQRLAWMPRGNSWS